MPVSKAVACLFALALSFSSLPAFANPSDPAAQRIDGFYDSLLAVMQGPKRDAKGRFDELAPAVDKTFDFAAMTAAAIGPDWEKLPDADRRALTDAFRRLTIASYARNFVSFAGEKFEVDDQVSTRDDDHIVRSRIMPPGKDVVDLTYRMRQAPDGWKIVDVYYNGSISEIARRRSEFAGTLESGGAQALAQKLNALADKAMTAAS